MLAAAARNWWAIALRGVLAILFGLVAIFWPLAALAALVLVFGVWALIDGIFAVVDAVLHWRRSPRWALLVEGVLGIILGVIALLSPMIAVLATVYVIAAWALVTGVLEIVNGIRLRKEIQGELWMILSGAISILFGLALTFWPLSGALAVTWLIGIYALVFGIFLLILGFRLKGLHERLGPAGGTQRSAA